MDTLSGYAHRPFAFVLRYLRQRLAPHVVILSCVIGAVASSVGTQYGVKSLVDALSGAGREPWGAFSLLVFLIAADNLLWRLASWVASFTFVGVTGDLRRDLFRHLTGHSLGYFADRMPGTLSSRITAASNAIYAVVSGRAKITADGGFDEVLERGDVTAMPCWHAHAIEAAEDAVVFRVTDEPIFAKLGLTRTARNG